MFIFDLDVFAVLGLVLAFMMTLIALAAYRSYETTRKRLLEREAELKYVQSSAQEFRQKTSEAFVDQKTLKVRIETLERSLALANEQLDKEREESDRLRSDIRQLRAEYETTKENLTEAYKRMREKPQ